MLTITIWSYSKRKQKSIWKKIEVSGSIIPDSFNEIINLMASSIISGEKSKYNAKDYLKISNLWRELIYLLNWKNQYK